MTFSSRKPLLIQKASFFQTISEIEMTEEQLQQVNIIGLSGGSGGGGGGGGWEFLWGDETELIHWQLWQLAIIKHPKYHRINTKSWSTDVCNKDYWFTQRWVTEYTVIVTINYVKSGRMIRRRRRRKFISIYTLFGDFENFQKFISI